MLGNSIKDPYEVETNNRSIKGLGLLDVETIFEKEKVTTRVKAQWYANSFTEDDIYGYEIHMGISSYGSKAKPLFKIEEVNKNEVSYADGAINAKGNIMGTYIHGVFDGTTFREHIVNLLRDKKGLTKKASSAYENLREKELDRLADIVRESLDMEMIYKIAGLK